MTARRRAFARRLLLEPKRTVAGIIITAVFPTDIFLARSFVSVVNRRCMVFGRQLETAQRGARERPNLAAAGKRSKTDAI